MFFFPTEYHTNLPQTDQTPPPRRYAMQEEINIYATITECKLNTKKSWQQQERGEREKEVKRDEVYYALNVV